MTDEQKNKNFSLYFKKLNEIAGNNTLNETLGEKLMNATYSIKLDTGLCGDGLFLQTILYRLTTFAVKINEILPEDKRIDKETLIKICLLHQIAKAVRFTPNDNVWEVEKKGILYKYADDNPSIRTGLHSLILAQQAGITFTAEEAEAMTVNDRDLTDDQARWHQSTLSSIIRMANEMTYIAS